MSRRNRSAYHDDHGCDHHHHHERVSHHQEVVYIEGPAGPRGKQGPMGCEGPPGRDGQAGVAGPPGQTGPKGQQGPRGPEGCAGERGPKGDTGPTGPTGPQGPEGPMGPQGDTGERGPQGDRGETGPQGPRGEEGAIGPRGDTGAQGETGATGAQGIQGPKGDQGDVGERGPQGDRGETGPIGPQGIQGEKGDQGDSGVDALVSCTPNADNTCYTMVFNTPTGSKTVDLSGCITLFSCGYTGTPQCETPTGAPVPAATSGETSVALQHPVDSATMFLQATPGQAGTVSNITTSVEGGYSCVEWDQTGTFTFNIVVDTTGLPTATKGGITCYPPLQPNLILEAPAGTSLNRKVGGQPVGNGWTGGTQSDGTVYAEQYPAPDYLQNFDQYVMGGTFSADFVGDGRMKVCYQHCYLEPVAAETDVGGTIIEACDSNGVFTPDGTTVLV